jgi:hypothetical protein
MSRKYDTEGLLGMHEMEMALEALLDRAKVLRCSLAQLVIYPNEYQSQLSGLCHMMCNGWIRSAYPNGTFKITQDLVNRMRERSCWKDIPDVTRDWL